MTKRTLARLTARALAVASSLGLVWLIAGSAAYALALTAGGARSAVAAFAAPPLTFAGLRALRALLGALMRRTEPRLGADLARREGEALMNDPDFLESLAQMQRGETRPARTVLEEMEGEE